MDYQIIVISEMHHDASGNAAKGSSPLNIASFDLTQTLLLLGVVKAFDLSSRGWLRTVALSQYTRAGA